MTSDIKNTYTGSLELKWDGKDESIILLNSDSSKYNQSSKKTKAVDTPKLSWVNSNGALFYEIDETQSFGKKPYWVSREDIRVRETRPLIFQRKFIAQEIDQPNQGQQQLLFEDNSCRKSFYQMKESDQEEIRDNSKPIENMLIRGDNLLALNSLKALFNQRDEQDKVKLIYIDPPYNTESAFKHYDDHLEHSQWLTLMRDRLILLRSLLREDGSIWISIDSNESHYLKVLCDEIFGRHNFIDEVIWQRAYAPINLKKTFSRSHDTILVYAKNLDILDSLNKLPRSQDANDRYSNPDHDPRGPWKSDNLSVGPAIDNKIYPITNPNTGKEYFPPKGYCWRFSQERMQEQLRDNRISFGKNGNAGPSIKRFLSEVKDGITPMTLWLREDVGDTQESKREVKQVNDIDIFETPKPERLIQRIIHLATNKGDLVLDSFAGSGTTLAVAHKMDRRYIGIEVGRHADTHIIPRLKDTLINQTPIGITEAVNWQGGGNFTYYHLGPSIVERSETTYDFNWQIPISQIQSSILSSYDFTAISPLSIKLEGISPKYMMGKQKNSGTLYTYGIVTIIKPNADGSINDSEIFMSKSEFTDLHKHVKNSLDYKHLVIFTNRAIEMTESAKPSDVTIIKVPTALIDHS